jgi:predicted dehydrogenase
MTLHIAIVGTGKVADQNYLPYIVERGDVSLSYYNRTRARAEAVAARHGGRVADSIAELMADDPDAVLVLTAETARSEVTDRLLAHGPKRLFFEKPLVAKNGQADVTEDDFFTGQDLLRRAHVAGTETAMVFNYRFFEQTVRARQIVAERNFGRPLHFTGLVHYACWSHCIDLVLDFFGPAQTITALAGEPGPCMGSDDVSPVTAAVGMANGAAGAIIGTCATEFKLPLYELTFAYEYGRIHMRDLDGDLEVLDNRTGQHEVHALPRDVSRWDQYRASFGKAINAYLDSLIAGAPPPVPGVAGLRELQFEAGIKRSIAARAPVDLDEAFPINI